jgi:hypothetical protein
MPVIFLPGRLSTLRRSPFGFSREKERHRFKVMHEILYGERLAAAIASLYFIHDIIQRRHSIDFGPNTSIYINGDLINLFLGRQLVSTHIFDGGHTGNIKYTKRKKNKE